MSQVVGHVASSISEASEVYAEAARAQLRGAGTPVLERLAAALAGAQHTPAPRAGRRVIVIAAGDHGCGDPGIALGADHPTVIAARAIADGSAAVCQVARASHDGTATGTPIVLVDAGVREPTHMPPIAIAVGGRGPSFDLAREPALTLVDAVAALEAGIALSLSLSETGLDVIALGALGLGSEVAAAALLGAASRAATTASETAPMAPPTTLTDAGAREAFARGAALPARTSGLELLGQFGGPETGVLAGLILGAASLHIPVILDGYATGAAALVAVRIAPAARGYLIAAHRGSDAMPAITEALGLVPAFEVGLGHGEGTGAAMLLPLLDQVAAIARPAGTG